MSKPFETDISDSNAITFPRYTYTCDVFTTSSVTVARAVSVCVIALVTVCVERCRYDEQKQDALFAFRALTAALSHESAARCSAGEAAIALDHDSSHRRLKTFIVRS